MATIANENMSSTNRPSFARQLTTTSGDYDLSYSPDVRRNLGTYGLTPPAVESYEVQAQRCKSTHEPCVGYRC
jgi:malate dehydrogenase (oxaloacetate-decarboxylating)(NADP+)